MAGRILVVEDDETFRSFLRTILTDEGHEVVTAGDGREGAALLARESFDVVVCDLKMPGKGGLALFRETRSDPSPPRFIFLTAYGTVDEAVAAMKEGAVDFLTKPLASPEVLLALVHREIETGERNRRLVSLKESEAAGIPPDGLVFAGEAMKRVLQLIASVAPTTATVLIHGESGTGKELISRFIHLRSGRGEAPFIPVNCAAIPENLLESELFGHEKGAFTGAVQARQGKFELARGGTLFLDEIGEMPVALQAKLLRVLQERAFERVGGSREMKADVRVVAATNRNLQKEVAEHRFREDLYYRLNVFPLTLPPLRDRPDAIPLLADYFLDRFSRQIGKRLQGIEPGALSALTRYAWPGNVRELQNVMERAVILAQGAVRIANLPDEFAGGSSSTGVDRKDAMKAKERELILAALKNNQGNRRLTAEELGVSRRTLQYKLKEYGLTDDVS